MSFQIENIEGELIRLIADQSSLPSFERFVGHAFIKSGVESYRLAWLDEKRNETVWLEHNYSYLFETKTEVINYEKNGILIIYYNGNTLAPQIQISMQVAIIHVYLTTAYRTKNDRRYMRQDLELAAKMQQMLVPKNLYCNKSFCATGLYIPNYKVGGDFYDVIPINDNKVGFCIGDISGKGINAAILMAHFIGFIRSTLLQNIKLEESIRIINAKMYELTEGEKFITLFLGIYNIQDRRLVYINSGHLPIPIYDTNGIEWLETGTTILGMFAELPFLELGKVKIEGKKQLLLYTDGLLNMTIDHMPFLSTQELDYIIHHECLGKPTDGITDYFREKVQGINVAEELKDDISVLALELE